MSRSEDRATRRIFRALLGLGLAALAAARGASALDPTKAITQYTLSVWRAEDGLPQDSLTAIAQAADGALWLGTPSGLVRFDGLEFQRLPERGERPPSSRYVTGLATAPDGTLWASTRDGLVELGPEPRHSGGGVVGNGSLLGLAFDSSGELWAAGESGLEQVVRHELHKRVLESPAAAAGLIAVAPGAHGRLWAATGTGLLALDGGSARLYARRDGLPSDVVTAVLEDRRGRVWVGTPLGLLRLEGERFVVPVGTRALTGVWIRSLCEDRNGNLWIGTRGAGVHRLRGEEVSTLTVADGMPSEFIRQIFEDREGSLWFTTAGGLARLTDGAVTPWAGREGLPNGLVWSVGEDPSGDLWLGTNGEGVVRASRSGRVAAGFDDRDLRGFEMRAVLADRAGALWFGTGGGGLLRVVAGAKRWYRESDGLPSGWVSSLLEDRRARIWVGTAKGLALLENGRVAATLGESEGLPNPVVRSLAEDPDGAIWVGTATGVARLEGDRVVPTGLAASVHDLRVHCILPRPGGEVWLATDGGLVHFAAGRVWRMTTRDGLPDDMLYWLLDDAAGHLWISTDRGIVRLTTRQVTELEAGERSELVPVLLDRSDGMRGTECNSGHPGGARRRDGTFCFATTLGIACVDPVRLRPFEDPPPTAIEQVLLDGIPVAITAAGAEPTVVVPADVRRLEIHYAAVALAAPEKVTFRYRLEGFDPAWVSIGRARTAQFTRLPPGDLRFVVASRRGGGAWSREAGLALRVLPPYYQTPTFFAALLAGLGLAIAGAVQLRGRQLRSRERRLRADVDQRTHELHVTTQRLAERTRDLEHANVELERLSLLDGLTRLANRRHFDARLETEWRRAARAGTVISLIMADIDFFKPYNDAYGHLAGDDCLRAIGAALAAAVQRAEDLAARYGGEELAVLLPGTSGADAERLAERLRRSIEALALAHGHSPVADRLTISLGVASVRPAPYSSSSDLVGAADRALYRAKAEGRNCVRGEGRST